MIINLRLGSSLQEGKYKIEEIIGQGGFGITYLAEQKIVLKGELGEMESVARVAIKEFFMKEHCNRDADTSHVSIPSLGSKDLVDRFKQKFIKEARQIAEFKHKHIVKVLDIFEENGTAYYVMEYVKDGSLGDYIKKNGALTEIEALFYVRQIAGALSYIHERNVNHLDIKPGNIMRREKDNNVESVLIDFGLAKRYDKEGEQTSSTPVGVSAGYAPMEQYNQGGVGKFSPSTDVYSLGATLYKLVTGNTPPNANDVNEDGLPAFPSNVSQSVKNAIEASMQPRRKDRPQSIGDFLEILNADVAEESENMVMAKSNAAAAVVESENTVMVESENTVMVGADDTVMVGSENTVIIPPTNVAPVNAASTNDVPDKPVSKPKLKSIKLGGVNSLKLKSKEDDVQRIEMEPKAKTEDAVPQSKEADVNAQAKSAVSEPEVASRFAKFRAESSQPKQDKSQKKRKSMIWAAACGMALLVSCAILAKTVWFPSENDTVTTDLANNENKVDVDSLDTTNNEVEIDAVIEENGQEIAENSSSSTPRKPKVENVAVSVQEEASEPEMSETVKHYLADAENGNAFAQYNLGTSYYYGQGVDKNLGEAVKWYTKAANQGNVDAQRSLATCYSYGYGVEKNADLAEMWNKMATSQSETSVQANTVSQEQTDVSTRTSTSTSRVAKPSSYVNSNVNSSNSGGSSSGRSM